MMTNKAYPLPRSYLAILAVALLGANLLAVGASGVACGGSSGGPGDAGPDVRAHEGGVEAGEAGAPALLSLSVTVAPNAMAGTSKMTMTPSFAPAVHDYYVRCAAATNSLQISMQANPGNDSLLQQPTSTAPKQGLQMLPSVSVKENQAVVAVAQNASGSIHVEYWVRCLPPDFPPYQWTTFPKAGTATPGYYLLGNFAGITGYAFVLDANGVPVWYHYEPSGGIVDVDNVVDGAISYIPAIGTSEALPFELYTLQPSLKETKVAPATGDPIDVHDLRVLPNGNYVGMTYPVETADLTGTTIQSGMTSIPGGPDMTILGCNIIEFTPAGQVVWTWKATDHLDPATTTVWPVTQNYLPEDAGLSDGGVPIAVFHCNSLDVAPNKRDLLVSSRQANTFWYVDRSTGNIVWKMGGSATTKDNAVYIPAPPPSPSFNGQHDVRLQSDWSTCAGGGISLYDDETHVQNPAQALLLNVNLGGKKGCDGGLAEGGTPTATIQERHVAPFNASVQASGSFRIYPDGSRVVGWGLGPTYVFSEYDAKGNKLLEVTGNPIPPLAIVPFGSYRAIKVPLTAFSLGAMRATAGQP